MQLPAASVLIIVGIAIGAAGVLVYHVRCIGRLNHLAETDPLTGLGNRRAWEALCAAQVPWGEQAVVMLADLCLFKQVNDAFDHGVGDLVLREFAHRLQRMVGPDGRAFRLGGDEFAVVVRLGRVSVAGAGSAAPRRAQALHSGVTGPWVVPEELDGSGWSTTTRAINIRSTVGVTSGSSQHLPGLLAVADRAMYTAKQAGRAVAYLPVTAPSMVLAGRPAVRRRDRAPRPTAFTPASTRRFRHRAVS